MKVILKLFPLILIISIIYTLPRILLIYFTEENPWANFIYMYALGSMVFLFGTTLAIKSGACQLRLAADRNWLIGSFIGLIYFMLLHAIWIYYSLHFPELH